MRYPFPTYTPVCMTPLFTTAKSWKQSSMDERLNNVWCRHTTDYYSALKRKGILTPATTWAYLEVLALHKRSETVTTDKHCKIPLAQGAQNGQMQRDRKNGAGGGRRREFLIKGHRV